MKRATRWLGAALLGVTSAGCVTSRPMDVSRTYAGSLSDDLTEASSAQGKARLQRPDQLPPMLPSPPNATPARPGPAAPPGGILPTSSIETGKKYKVSVSAWVNGKPLFDEEIFQGLPPGAIQQVQGLAEPQRTERIQELIQRQRDNTIDQELLYQDAVTKLEKNNPKALEKIKGLAFQEFEKRMRMATKDGRITEEQLRDQSKLIQRLVEREYISRQYMQSRVYPLLDRINPEMVREYYDGHLNEFQKVETVDWQHVFISVERHGSVEKARRFAEELAQTCRTPDDFSRLMKYDDGTAAKYNNGKGLGTRRGEIKPPELEATLFRMRDGEIGPVVDAGTGVHLFRLLKREAGGVVPFDEKTQKSIRDKLRSDLAEREAKRIVRDLRSRATIEYDDTP